MRTKKPEQYADAEKGKIAAIFSFFHLIKKYSLYERLRLWGTEGIAIAAQASHSVGSPMSQRECAGFN